jgi:hypothetical protein
LLKNYIEKRINPKRNPSDSSVVICLQAIEQYSLVSERKKVLILMLNQGEVFITSFAVSLDC